MSFFEQLMDSYSFPYFEPFKKVWKSSEVQFLLNWLQRVGLTVVI